LNAARLLTPNPKTELARRARPVMFFDDERERNIGAREGPPPRERRKFFESVHELEAEPAARRKRPIRWPDAAARRAREFLATRFCPIWFCWRGNRSTTNTA